MALFIFDFDLTITSQHTHNLIIDQINQEHDSKLKITRKDPQKRWSLIADVQPIGSKSEWKQLFSNITRSGHQIAIASFGKYGKEIIPRYLEEVIGLDQTLLNKIFINSWNPKSNMPQNKNAHILEVFEFFDIQGEKQKETVLIDDALANIDAAALEGYHPVYANGEGSHLRTTKEILEAINTNPQFFYEPVKEEYISDVDDDYSLSYSF